MCSVLVTPETLSKEMFSRSRFLHWRIILLFYGQNYRNPPEIWHNYTSRVSADERNMKQPL